jgi:hypothetical protein
MRPILVVLLAVVAMTFVAAPTVEAKPKHSKEPDKDAFELGDLVDMQLFYAELGTLKILREESRKLSINLHNTVMKLSEQPEKAEEMKLRALVQKNLIDLRRVKKAHIAKVNAILKRKPSKMTDIEVLKALEKSLGSVDWEDKYFRECCDEISKTIGTRVTYNRKVNKWNGVFLRMPDVSAGGVLKWICAGFDLKWMIYEGEIYITKKLGPNEDRYIRYEKKHGKVNYWKKEPDELMKTVDGKRVPQTVQDMDLDILRKNLLKFFVFEEESVKHQEQLAKLKFEKQVIEKDQLATANPKLLKLAKKRERWVVHYMRLEKESAIELLDIISRCIGDKVRLHDDGNEWRRIRETPVKGIFWDNLPLDQALAELGKKVGVPVVAEIPLIEVPYISLKVDTANLEALIKMITDIHPMDVKFTKGKIYFFWK